MLKQRVITAVVLLALLLPALFYQESWAWRSVTLVLVASAGWEWSRLNGLGQFAAWLFGFACLLACVMSWDLGLTERSLPALWVVAASSWVLLGAALLRRGVAGWRELPQALRLSGGLMALWLLWLAVVQAHSIGAGFLLSVLASVWVADIGAYFSGRTLGGRFIKNKLAPTISPGKTWEGVWGGAFGVLLLALAWGITETGTLGLSVSLFSHLLNQANALILILGMLLLTGMSVVGDLLESLVKRSAGVKDSSRLLPGHGGVLDRIDALLPTLPLAMMFYSLLKP